MTRLDDLMAGPMSRAASTSGMFGASLTLYNFTDENADTTDAPDWSKDSGTQIEGHIDWGGTEDVVETVGGEEVRADAKCYTPTEYDVRDGRRSGERASVIEDPEGNEFRIESAHTEAGVYVCQMTLRETPVDEDF